jgi:hypothetical protein
MGVLLVRQPAADREEVFEIFDHCVLECLLRRASRADRGARWVRVVPFRDDCFNRRLSLVQQGL